MRMGRCCMLLCTGDDAGARSYAEVGGEETHGGAGGKEYLYVRDLPSRARVITMVSSQSLRLQGRILPWAREWRMRARLLMLLDAWELYGGMQGDRGQKWYIAWSYLLSYGGKEVFLLSLQK